MRASIAALLVSMTAIAAACTGMDTEDNPCIDTGTCPSYNDDAGDSGNAGDTGDAVAIDGAIPDGGCDLSAGPHDAACVIDEANGVFVSVSGDDTTADGSKAKPFGSFSAATAAAATAGKPRVFVCGVWAKPAAITVAGDGVSIYGGFDCDTWTYNAEKNRTIVAPLSGTALTIAQIAKGITIEDVSFVAANATAPGASSIAAQVTGSQHVTFRRATFTAGAGVDGASGTTPTADIGTPKKGNDAPQAPSTSGGAAVTCVCANGVSSIGAAGGSGGVTATDGEIGQPELSNNKGNTGLQCSIGTGGASAPATPEGAGAKTPGALVDGSWIPAPGAVGATGGTGQGGGGGGGVTGIGNGGAGGGCGGCGGGGGGAGSGGGASIALLVVSSDVSLYASTLQSAKGGAGGAGAAGQNGAAGAAKGNSIGTGNGCQGGPGGAGANGGAGGGGAGGLSVAIAFSGTAPKTDAATTLTPGTAGAAGKGGKPGTNDGIAGDAKATFEIH
jgi:hypothetical protein